MSEPRPSFIYLVGRLDHGIRREMRRQLQPWRLTVAEYTTLSALKNRPGLSNAQLARRAMITPQSMIQVLAGLERRGLLGRAVDPQHKKILRAQLTASGVKMLAETTSVIDGLQDEIFASLSAQERETILSGLIEAVNTLTPNAGGGEAAVRDTDRTGAE